MATFDSWEVAVRPPEDYLMHFRTKGSKNGVRRYQTESGEWTELGLRERRKREGWGDGRKERRANRYEKKIQKAQLKGDGQKVSYYVYKRNKAKGLVSKEDDKFIKKQMKLDKMEDRFNKRQDKKAEKAQRKIDRVEEKRKRSLKGLTDEEMKAKLERAKIEAEYRDLTKKHSLMETGAKLVTKYLDYKSGKEQRALDMNRQKIEMERLKTQQLQSKTQQIQAKENTKQSKNQIQISRNEANKMGAEAKKMAFDVKGGLKIKRKAEYKDAKTRYKAETRGAISTWLKNKANKGKEERANAHELKKLDYQLQEQREKRANAETVAKSNADQAKYKVDQERYKADQEKSKASQSASERTWKETQANTEYEKEKKKPKK